MAFTSDKLERARDDLLEAVRNADADLADKLVAKDNPTGSAFAHIRMLVRMAPAKRSQGENLHIRDDRRPVLGRRSPGHKRHGRSRTPDWVLLCRFLAQTGPSAATGLRSAHRCKRRCKTRPR